MAGSGKVVFKSGLLRWIDDRLPIVSALYNDAVIYQTPRNLNYWWNFGSLAGIVLMLQIVTGIVLVMQYTPATVMAFDSVERIMRDVNYGWLLRYAHANGASMFFVILYIHMLKALYYGSYKMPRELLWMLGVVILLLSMATAFMGYVLPWGQMSFWGAQVITSLFGALPLVGDPIVTWLWGGFAVDNPTLNRFFSLHYLLPFVMVGVVFLHLIALHVNGSNNPVGIDLSAKDKIPFHPYYTVKDIFGLAVFMLVFSYFVFFNPNVLGHPDNYIPANPLITPAHIVPEWYFLPFYAILRSTVYDSLFIVLYPLSYIGITEKLMGVIAMFGSIAVLFVVPWLDPSRVRSASFRPIYRWVFWLLVIDGIILGWVGGQPVTPTVVLIGQLATLYYFAHFLVILPLLGRFERPLPLPDSIGTPVLRRDPAAQPAE
jgi:quinol-cytochrome oxidoreductase complex cytochrome b subunit